MILRNTIYLSLIIIFSVILTLRGVLGEYTMVERCLCG